MKTIDENRILCQIRFASTAMTTITATAAAAAGAVEVATTTTTTTKTTFSTYVWHFQKHFDRQHIMLVAHSDAKQRNNSQGAALVAAATTKTITPATIITTIASKSNRVKT